MCELVEVPRSSFYAWMNRTPSARDLADAELLVEIRDIYRRSRNTYGVPRVYGQLRRTGHRVARSPGRSADARRTAWSEHTRRRSGGVADPMPAALPDLLHRDFTRRAPEPALGRRRHRVPDRRRQALPRRDPRPVPPRDRRLGHLRPSRRRPWSCHALTMALARTGHPAEVIHHADKGSIYTSLDFAFAAGNADMNLSFGSTGDAYDNAAMETFWARLKVEIAWIRGSIWFETRAEAHAYLFEFIEVFYNRQRHQAGLGHLTPAEYADKWRHDHGEPNLA